MRTLIVQKWTYGVERLKKNMKNPHELELAYLLLI